MAYNEPYDYEKERQEAIRAGERALDSLRSAQKHLNSARNWGMYDMFGGGFISTMIKHSKMDDAKADMEQARYDLRSFSRELQDVERNIDLDIETGDFLSFADWFFDGFAADFMMQSRINQARQKVDEAIRRVEDILYHLRRS